MVRRAPLRLVGYSWRCDGQRTLARSRHLRATHRRWPSPRLRRAPPLPVHLMLVPRTGSFLSLTTCTGRNPSGIAIATSRPSSGTSTRRIYVEFAMRTSTFAGPGGKFVSVTRPSPSVTPRHPDGIGRMGNRRWWRRDVRRRGNLSARLRPKGRRDAKPARPPITSGVSAVPLVATGMTRDAVSHTPAHRSTAVVEMRY